MTARPGRVASTRLAVLALVTAAACTSGTDERPERSQSTTRATTTTAGRPSGRTYQPSGPAVELSAGQLVGLSADGSSAYVAISEPGAPMGCEGLAAPALFTVPLAGGAPVRATPDLAEPVSGTLLQSADGRRVALVESCEEFFGGLRVGEQQGSTIRGLKTVAVRLESEAAPRLAWSGDGQRLFGAAGGDVVAVDPATGAVTVVKDVGGAVAAAELADGTLVVVTDKEVVVGSRSVPGGGWGLVLSPDRNRVAVLGDQGLRVVDREATVEKVAGGTVELAAWSPDGAALAYASQLRLRVVVPGSEAVDVARRVANAEFTRDGKALVYSQLGSGQEGRPDGTVSVVPLA